ncbi:UNVERIFIED_CONTAM: hypothetical protein Cloal_2528 [Acetivibrio alkalicellulosi]
MKMKLIAVILSVIFLMGVGGCMSNNNNNNKNDVSIKDLMMEHMSEKYNEEFVFENINTEVWTAPYTEMILSSEKFPGHSIVVYRYKDSGEIVDNYMDFYMKERIEKEISEILAGVYSNSKVFYRTGGRPVSNSVTPDISISEYAKATIIGLTLTICIEDPDYEANKDEKIEQLRKVLEEKKYMSSLDVFYVKEGKLDLINDSNQSEVLTGPSNAETVLVRGGFAMNDSFEFDYYKWRDIK